MSHDSLRHSGEPLRGAATRLGAILDEAQREPVVIRRQDRDIAVVLSMADYERLRAGNIQAFLDLRNEIAAQVIRNGLTEERLAELLTDDGKWARRHRHQRPDQRPALHDINSGESCQAQSPRTAQPADVGLILDSSVAIAAERRGDSLQAFPQRVIDAAGDQEAALSAAASWNSSTESTVLIRRPPGTP